MSSSQAFRIMPATPADLGEIQAMIRELADYERLAHLCVSSETDLADALFGERPAAEVIVGREGEQAAAFALYFHNYSTFLGRRGLYLEDLFVRPAFRRRGYAGKMLAHLARVAKERDCGRFEWAVLDWNAPAIAFYQSLGADVLPDWRITRVTGEALKTLASRA
jgi:GNAT superfamily N-acetyltransferase